MNKRIIFAATLAFSCILMSNPVLALPELPKEEIMEIKSFEVHEQRLYGENRYETARIISQYYRDKLWTEKKKEAPEKLENVVIATGKGYADALAASVLAKELQAPIILVAGKAEEDQEAFAFVLENLDPQGKIYIMGGEGIIGKDIEQKLMDLGFNIIRLAGKDRYETSCLIAESLEKSDFSTVVIASGEQYADALGISSIAAHEVWPVLLTSAQSLPPQVKELLREKKPEKVYIIGGTGSVSEQVMGELEEMLPFAELERIKGQSRFETNINIAQTFAPQPETIYLTTGFNYADALAGSVLAAEKGEPIIFLDPSSPTLPKATAQYIEALAQEEKKPNLVVFGGPGAVSDEILKTVRDLLTGTVKGTDLHSIPALKATAVKGKPYTLPSMVKGRLYNSELVDLEVLWDTKTVNTQTVGLQVIEGWVESHGKPVKLQLTVTNPLPLGEYTTYFNVNEINRSDNLRLAAAAINNKRVDPGEIFSFNGVVGQRTIEAGYKEAMVIEGDKFIPGVGGGVCQVSSTLFNAVSRAQLEIVERHHHSLPVGYVPPGQDATVYYPVLDFRFRNNLQTSVLIKAFTEGGTLTVQIFEDI